MKTFSNFILGSSNYACLVAQRSIPKTPCQSLVSLTTGCFQGVAVISYGDERLAPSRTAIYIIIAVILFLALTGTLVVLFYPRTVSNARDRSDFM